MFQEYRDILNGTYRRRSAMNTTLGIVGGLLVGAIAGIQLAPKSGKETRADIAEGVKKGAAKVKEVTEEAAGAAKEKFEGLKTRVGKTAKKEEPAQADKKE